MERVVQDHGSLLFRGMEAATVADEQAAFTAFVDDVEPRLRRAFTLLRGPDLAQEASAEALAWAWEHWAEVQAMANPAGYLYRVGASRTRHRAPRFPLAVPAEPVGFEPGLVPALARLTSRQRTVVVLVHGCGWTHQEVADALGLTRSSVGAHVHRAMDRLRRDLGVER
jgi:DNA-directed RNA polymerase specialized sigma24 family protein